MNNDDVQIRLRATLEAIPTYVPKKPAHAEPSITTYKLSSNENPYPPLPAVQTMVEQAATLMNQYPNIFTTKLIQAITNHLGIPTEYIATKTNNVKILKQIVTATCSKKNEIIFA